MLLELGDLYFKKYQDSQIKIKDYFQLVRGKTPPTKNPEYYENGNLPWLDGGSLNGYQFLTDKTKPSKLITKKAKIECRLPTIEPNSVIFSNVNTCPNKIVFVKTSKQFTFSNHVWQLNSINKFENSCLFFALRQVNFKYCSVGTCFSEIQGSLFMNMKINWVSDPTKQKIFPLLLNKEIQARNLNDLWQKLITK